MNTCILTCDDTEICIAVFRTMMFCPGLSVSCVAARTLQSWHIILAITRQRCMRRTSARRRYRILVLGNQGKVSENFGTISSKKFTLLIQFSYNLQDSQWTNISLRNIGDPSRHGEMGLLVLRVLSRDEVSCRTMMHSSGTISALLRT